MSCRYACGAHLYFGAFMRAVTAQNELDAYDKHQKVLEEKLDEKTAALIHMQRVAMEHSPSTHTGAGVRASTPSSTPTAWGEDEDTSRVPSSLLVTTKRYKPFNDTPVVFDAEGEQPNTPAEGRLLSAEEKIAELTAVVEAARSESERLRKELEEVAAEKVTVVRNTTQRTHAQAVGALGLTFAHWLPALARAGVFAPRAAGKARADGDRSAAGEDRKSVV